MTTKLLSYKQAAAFLNVEIGTLYAKVCRKEIPHLRLSGRLVRFDADELSEWVKAHHIPDSTNSRCEEEANA